MERRAGRKVGAGKLPRKKKKQKHFPYNGRHGKQRGQGRESAILDKQEPHFVECSEGGRLGLSTELARSHLRIKEEGKCGWSRRRGKSGQLPRGSTRNCGRKRSTKRQKSSRGGRGWDRECERARGREEEGGAKKRSWISREQRCCRTE
ncbi:hypothetical protein KM043_001835 [Ampulex compressa]|nr:hypothetical protein KM043_001835 [Ampulex compressa]